MSRSAAQPGAELTGVVTRRCPSAESAIDLRFPIVADIGLGQCFASHRKRRVIFKSGRSAQENQRVISGTGRSPGGWQHEPDAAPAGADRYAVPIDKNF